MDHTITISNKKRQPTTYSKRDVAIPNEPQASTSKQTTRNLQFKQPPMSSPEPANYDKPNKITKPTNTTKPKKSKLPKKFHRLTNWEKLANDSTDEEEESRKQKTAVKATVQREKTTTKTEPVTEEEETTSQQSTERPKRERKTANYFGNPVMICDIEQKPEIITISSSTEEN